MRFIPKYLIIGILLGVAAPTSAQEQLPYDRVFDGECVPDNADQFTVNEIAENSSLLIGRCVTISGYAQGWQVFSGADDIYRNWRAEIDRQRQASEGRVIRSGSPYVVGIQHNDIPVPSDGPWAYEITITGHVADCDALSEAAWRYSFRERTSGSGTIIVPMLGGYCHHNYGAMIIPASIEYGQRRTFVRKVGMADRRTFGSIWPLSENHSLYNELRRLSLTVYEAFRSGDAVALAELNGSRGHTWTDEFAEFESDFVARIRTADDAPQMAFFVAGLDGPDERASRSGGLSTSYLCYCREGNCDEQWPISVFDTYVDERRPYVCLTRVAGIIANDEPYDEISADLPEGQNDLSPFIEPALPPRP